MAFLESTLRPGVVQLAFNRPEKRNALSIDMINAVCDRVDELQADPANRVAVIRGAGKVFSAGLDLAEATDLSKVDASAAAVARVLELMRDTPLITVAVVQGGAYAGGAGVMSACDIVISANDASFGFPEARRGLLPALIAGAVSIRVQQAAMRELFLTGRIIAAAEAHRLGLIDYLVAAPELDAALAEVCDGLLAGGPETIRQTKVLMNRLFPLSPDQRPKSMLGSHLEARRSDEAREGLAAFLEKRLPGWST
jgi:methylglutaconyl-CoA hydratase